METTGSDPRNSDCMHAEYIELVKEGALRRPSDLKRRSMQLVLGIDEREHRCLSKKVKELIHDHELIEERFNTVEARSWRDSAIQHLLESHKELLSGRRWGSSLPPHWEKARHACLCVEFSNMSRNMRRKIHRNIPRNIHRNAHQNSKEAIVSDWYLPPSERSVPPPSTAWPSQSANQKPTDMCLAGPSNKTRPELMIIMRNIENGKLGYTIPKLILRKPARESWGLADVDYERFLEVVRGVEFNEECQSMSWWHDHKAGGHWVRIRNESDLRTAVFERHYRDEALFLEIIVHPGPTVNGVPSQELPIVEPGPGKDKGAFLRGDYLAMFFQ